MIRTERLTLRPARPDDLDALHAIFTDPRAMRYWDRPPHDAIAQTQRFLNGFMTPDDQRREEYILDLDGRCIGKAGIWARPEVGFILHPDHWRRGYVREALEAILPRCFRKWPEMPEITAECDPRNLASVGLLTRLGFRLTGFDRQNFDYGGIEMCDTAYFALPRRIRKAD
ncbi:GNAT family N-acetyltransferase [Thalassococcus sp. CAU 1522]|uniref:GNAT family N-acetyltransferase n=1 Tax=Thalassococcus arenae TaxID=2851652 RepID=A0ABS6NAB4_9RHOB|nr:GNAT family N-acetyltransferase [Thalassococcus arenae]